jgi:glutaconate CoA-transferase, subunit B
VSYSSAETMIAVAARTLNNHERVFVGIGLPNLASNLARRLYAPNVVLIYEAGVIGAEPVRLPISIGDPCLVTGSLAVCSFHEIFANYLQRGLIDVGFLGGAQIDRYGNINTTVVGDYNKPKVRLGGSGGGCEIAIFANKIITIIPHDLRHFPAKVDFITSPGFMGGREERDKLGFRGGGPEKVITNLGVLEFDEHGEMVLTQVHPGVTVDKVKENTGWDLKVASGLKETDPPTDEELHVLRNELDPDGVYLGRRNG